MTATTEIDKLGRLVIPKKMRDALHLVPGTRITVTDRSGALVLSPEAKPGGLLMDRGTLVYDAGPGPAIDVLDWLRKDRDERIQDLSGR